MSSSPARRASGQQDGCQPQRNAKAGKPRQLHIDGVCFSQPGHASWALCMTPGASSSKAGRRLGTGTATTQSLNLLSHAYGLQCMSALKADAVWWKSPAQPIGRLTHATCRAHAPGARANTHLACDALLFSPELPKLLLSGLMIRLHPPQRAVCRTATHTPPQQKHHHQKMCLGTDSIGPSFSFKTASLLIFFNVISASGWPTKRAHSNSTVSWQM